MCSTIIKEQLIKIIEDALEKDELAIFIGAGLSIDAGYPTWEELLEMPAKKLGLDISKEKYDLISLAQFYFNENNRDAINELLKSSFPTNAKPTKNHKILSQLPISTYWTTNYDTLIEKAIKESNKKVSVRKNDKDLQISSKNYDAVVYKMHGDIRNISEAVITRDDYEEYGVNSRKLFRNVLESSLLTKTFLFLGFSFNDPNFNFVLSKLRVLLEGKPRDHYYILKKNNDTNLNKQKLQIKDLDRYGIKVYLIDDYEDITKILTKILNRYRRKTIFISGSAEEYGKMGKENAQKFIKRLAYRLEEKGYMVVNGYGKGVGQGIINGITEYCCKQNVKIEERLKIMPFPLIKNNENEVKQNWRKYREEMIAQCGIGIYIFGNKKIKGNIVNAYGVEKEYNFAKDKDLINIPLAFTGYMAKKLYDENSEEIKKYISDDRIKYIEEFYNIEENIKGIIEIINKIKDKEESV